MQFAGVFASHPTTADRIRRLERFTWPTPPPYAVPNALSGTRSFMAADPWADMEIVARGLGSSGQVPEMFCSACGHRSTVLDNGGQLKRYCERCGRPVSLSELQAVLFP